MNKINKNSIIFGLILVIFAFALVATPAEARNEDEVYGGESYGGWHEDYQEPRKFTQTNQNNDTKYGGGGYGTWYGNYQEPEKPTPKPIADDEYSTHSTMFNMFSFNRGDDNDNQNDQENDNEEPEDNYSEDDEEYDNYGNMTDDSENGGSGENENLGGLAANALFGVDSFMPSGLTQWIFIAIIILLLVVLARKYFGGEQAYQTTPLKHA